MTENSDATRRGANGRRIHPGSCYLAAQIVALMDERGISIRDLAQLLGCSPRNVGAVIDATVNFPESRAEAWADALELTGGMREAFLDLAALANLSSRGIRVIERLAGSLAQVACRN